MAFSDESTYRGVYANLHTPAVIIGGTFALIALVLSLWLILQHLRSYTNPAEQKWIIGVIFMVPVYAIESIISLSTTRFSIACDILRNCYEAFALYSFGSYLVACLGGEEEVIELLEKEGGKDLHEQLLENKEESEVRRSTLHQFFCHPSLLGKGLYTIVKFGLVQYMILKTLCAFVALILELVGIYGDGEFKWYYGYPYIAVVLNFSQMWALYCLVQFYNTTHHRLQAIKPLAKFISFKAIVFATWWQGLGIALICYFGMLPKEGKIQNGIQDFLICVEMAIAATAHIFVFSPEPYRYLPASECGEVTAVETTAKLELDHDGNEEPAVVEQTETSVHAPGTSVTESVQDVVLGGGETVVKDVVLTISQAMEPVEKGVNKIQETFHHISLGSEKQEKEPTLEIKEHVQKNVKEGNPHVIKAEKEIKAESGLCMLKDTVKKQ